MQNYSVRELSEEEFKPLIEQYRSQLFADTHSYDFNDVLNTAELAKIEELRQNLGVPYKLFLGVFDCHHQFVGWSWGIQENATTFYMVNSAVLAEHRRKGVYSLLLRYCVDILTRKGFQLVYSRHCATNNAVIIPKLKEGFIISKMEIDDRFGVLIHLHFYTNSNRRKIMDYRSGQSKPDEVIKEAFKL